MTLQDHREKITALLTAGQCRNLSLLLYKFSDGLTDKKRQVLWADTARAGNAILTGQVERKLLSALEGRQKESLKSLEKLGYQTRTIPASVDWRLLVGLSYGKLWNISFQLHPLYGVPFIPASGIKGALAHFVYEFYRSDPDLGKVFGGPDNRGEVIFLDAFGTRSKGRFFDEDVLNVHYKDYYSGEDKAPADYCEPVPVKFLAIAKDVEFDFRFAARDGLADKVDSWLVECLQDYGVGAKTRVNYGHFRILR